MVGQGGTGSLTCFEVIASTAKMHDGREVGFMQSGDEQAVVWPPLSREYPTHQSQIKRHLGPSTPHSSIGTPTLSFIKLASTVVDDRYCHRPQRRSLALLFQGVHLFNSIEIPEASPAYKPSPLCLCHSAYDIPRPTSCSHV